MTSSSLEPWAIVFMAIGAAVALYFVLKSLVKVWAKQAYKKLLRSPKTSCDIDAFVGPKHPVSATKVVLAHKIQLGSRKASLDPIPLEVFDSPHVPGLKVSRKAGSPSKSSDRNVTLMDQLLAEADKSPIVIATIRMGFGHHRIAYAAASCALKTGRPTIFHDLLSIQSPEADLIKSTDELYSRFSRYASELGGPVEKLWGSAMRKFKPTNILRSPSALTHLIPTYL